MRFELFVATRYLRAKRRQAVIGVITIISVVGVAAGVASLVIALSINGGFQKDLQNQLLGSTSHVSLQRVKDDGGISDWRPLMERLEKHPHVIGAAPAMYDQVMGSRGARASGMLLKGVVPEYENKVSELLKSIKLGSAAALNPVHGCPEDKNCQSGGELPPIVLGKDLAETIGATVGSVIMVTSPQGELTPFGIVPKFEKFKVVGIFRSGFYNYDSAWGFIRLSDAQHLFSLGDVITVIEFKLDDLYKAGEVGEELQNVAGTGFMAKNWMDDNRALFQALRLERVVTHFIPLSAEVYSIDYLPFAPRLLDGVLVAAVALLVSFVATLYPSWSAARVLPAEALRYE